jgi:branched-chain amino acid transport system permease protein
MHTRDGLRFGLISLGTLAFLIIIGVPQTAGSFLWPLFALVVLFMGAQHGRRAPGTAGPPLTETVVNGLLTGLIAGVGTSLVTYIFASMMASGVKIQPVLDKVVPENMAALTRSTKEAIEAGEPIVGALVGLALVLTMAGGLGVLVSHLLGIMRSRERRESEQRMLAIIGRWLAIALPFVLFGVVLLFDAPGVRVGKSQADESIARLLVVFVTIGAGLFAMRLTREGAERWIVGVALGVIVFVLPLFMDPFQNSVMNSVAIFVMLGLGLNVVVGFAGLLDLGYVAFFAIGAYVYGMLAAPNSIVLLSSPGFGGITFWVGIPLAIIGAAIAGILLGIPVLRMRGDYLAIVTLGFGEIIRLLLLNMREVTYGPRGLHNLPSPILFGLNLGDPRGLLYLGLVGSVIIVLITDRLNNSRLGRAWIAMREDEDVAQAAGINLVANKLQAFAFGAAFAGLGGILFAARQVNIFPDNFTLFVSIDVLSLIIIGGIGSIEGVILGSIALIGLPEVLRGVDEFRILAFGALLVIMMIVRPEGLLPSARRQRELHHADELAASLAAESPVGD